MKNQVQAFVGDIKVCAHDTKGCESKQKQEEESFKSAGDYSPDRTLYMTQDFARSKDETEDYKVKNVTERTKVEYSQDSNAHEDVADDDFPFT